MSLLNLINFILVIFKHNNYFTNSFYLLKDFLRKIKYIKKLKILASKSLFEIIII